MNWDLVVYSPGKKIDLNIVKCCKTRYEFLKSELDCELYKPLFLVWDSVIKLDPVCGCIKAYNNILLHVKSIKGDKSG